MKVIESAFDNQLLIPSQSNGNYLKQVCTDANTSPRTIITKLIESLSGGDVKNIIKRNLFIDKNTTMIIAAHELSLKRLIFYRVMCYSLTSTEPLQLATVEKEVKKDVESFTATVTDLTVYRQEMYFTWKNLKSVVEETTGKIPVEAVEHIYEFLLNNYEQMNNTHFVIMVQPGVNDNFQELFWKCKEDSCVYFTDSDSNKFIFILKAPKADSYKRECKSLKDFADAEHRKNWCQFHQDKSLSTFGVEVNACNMRSYVIMSYKALLANSASGPAFGTYTFILSRAGIFGIGEKCLGKVHVFSRFSNCDPSTEKCQ